MTKLTDVMPSRIRDLRLQRGWSQGDLAERAGTTIATISKMERSMRGLSLDWVERLASALDMSAHALLGSGQPAGLRTIPVVGRIAAGNWQEAIEDPVGHIVVPDDVGPNAFALEPHGDSMDMVAPAGSIVVIDPDQHELRDGAIYAIMNGGGETTLKQFRADPARLEPQSSNPDHKTIALGREPFTVIGRAVSVNRRL
ncbi:S24 family peptidase [uncultured Sphingomonas sp.]|uniref:LexA family protein n=1 Tax=uncultured Sphingomonas sp. TaxID=158754 RepID=UPI0025F1A5B6|nr:S24 family peptidase [uncultured Sphingomonas sp.]